MSGLLLSGHDPPFVCITMTHHNHLIRPAQASPVNGHKKCHPDTLHTAPTYLGDHLQTWLGKSNCMNASHFVIQNICDHFRVCFIEGVFPIIMLECTSWVTTRGQITPPGLDTTSHHQTLDTNSDGCRDWRIIRFVQITESLNPLQPHSGYHHG